MCHQQATIKIIDQENFYENYSKNDRTKRCKTIDYFHKNFVEIYAGCTLIDYYPNNGLLTMD